MEVLHDSCDGLYEAQPNCTATVGEMRRLGFAPLAPRFRCADRAFFTQGSGCEANVLFRNERMAPQPGGPAERQQQGSEERRGQAPKQRQQLRRGAALNRSLTSRVAMALGAGRPRGIRQHRDRAS